MQVSFVNSPDLPALYVAATGPADAGWCAFLVLSGSVPATTLSLAEVWALPAASTAAYGTFLFAPAAPTGPLGPLVERVRTFFDGQTLASHQFLWLQDAAGTVPLTEINCYWLSTYQGSFYVLVAADFNVPFGNFVTLSLTHNVIIDLNDDASAIRFTYFNYFSLVRFAPGPVPGVPGPVVDAQSYLSMAGPGRGCFAFTLLLQDQRVLDSLGPSARFFYQPDPLAQPQSYLELGSSIFVASPQNPLALGGSADPLDPFNGKVTLGGQLVPRTYLGFVPSAQAPATALSTALRCDTGQPLALTPRADAPGLPAPSPYGARLVLQPRCVAEPLLPASFVPTGDFYLSVPGAALLDDQGKPRVFQLLPGLSGTETISFFPAREGYVGDLVRFTPGGAAFSAGFPFPDVSLTAGSAAPPPLLQDSWRTVTYNVLASGAMEPQYSAQPAGASLYAANQPQVGADPAFLGFFEPGVGLSQHPDFGFPAALYGSLAPQPPFTVQQFVDFEQLVLSPARKRQIQTPAAVRTPDKRALLAANGALPRASGPTWATTPQGLLAQVGPDARWLEVQLARYATVQNYAYLRFCHLTLPLQNALQSSQLFVVATNNRYLGTPTAAGPAPGTAPPTFQNRLAIEQWAFAVNTGGSPNYSDKSNVLILKYCDGKLSDLICNPGKWDDAVGFNALDPDNVLPNELTATSQWLQDYCEQARQQYAGGNKLFQNFCTILDEPAWHGVLLLKVDVLQFPDDIQGILAGIDTTRLNGHHIGIELNRVQRDAGPAGDLELAGNSSLFGLINYVDPAYQQLLAAANGQDVSDVPVAPPPGVDYDFKVLSLQVLFENARIKSFHSKVQLTLNKLFADQVVQMNCAATGPTQLNSVVLNGSLQRYGGRSVYIFDETGNNLFSLAGSVLNAVSLVKVQFNTLQQDDSQPGNPLVKSRFTLWGYLNFTALTGMDVFSFGTPLSSPALLTGPVPAPTGLYFSNLYVEMQFPANAPAARTFSFVAAQTAFDTSVCPPRQNSLVADFALQPASLLQPPAGTITTSAGYLPVLAQGLTLTGLGTEWFGLNMTLNLGSPGALAGQAGFVTTMLLAWGPGGTSTTYPAWLGLKLPGAGSGASLLSIQGVLKLSVGSIQLFCVPTATPGASSFLLQLNRIALSFLGLLKLPPGGNTSFFLFGNPQSNATTKSLGWYAAWVKDEKKAALTALESPALSSGLLAENPAT